MPDCFLDKERRCEMSCMAYQAKPLVNGGNPTCFFIQAAHVVQAAVALFIQPQNKVSHPVSVPPPEVKV